MKIKYKILIGIFIIIFGIVYIYTEPFEDSRLKKIRENIARETEAKQKDLKDKYIEILESNKTYEEMTSTERTAALEIVGEYWDKLLDKDEQEKYLSRKEFIEKSKDEAVAKWKLEADEERAKENNKINSEEVDYKKENINEIEKKSDISSLKFGKLLNTTINGNTLIIKAKISPSYSNTATINQNGHNVEDIILNQGGDSFDEIQYWAVSDMTDGSESKVISFTLKKKQIDLVKNNKLFGRDIVSQASDVWILPSLKN